MAAALDDDELAAGRLGQPLCVRHRADVDGVGGAAVDEHRAAHSSSFPPRRLRIGDEALLAGEDALRGQLSAQYSSMSRWADSECGSVNTRSFIHHVQNSV